MLEQCNYCGAECEAPRSLHNEPYCDECQEWLFEECERCGRRNYWRDGCDCFFEEEEAVSDRPDDSASIDPCLVHILKTSNVQGQVYARDLLREHYPVVTVVDEFVYAAGTIPVLLVAHTDTVLEGPPDRLWLDDATVSAPNGLGADDRAGVYAIARLLCQGLRPHVLLTDGEERGGTGAASAAKHLPCPDVRLMIELDRAGRNDAVYYSCLNPALERWIAKRGFKTAIGSFTDISMLMPAWGIAGVNLSVGYDAQHTDSESLDLAILERTIKRVSQMLRHPPRWPFAYRRRAEQLAVYHWRRDDLALSLDNNFDWRFNHHRKEQIP